MEYRRLGKSGLKVSVLSFGSWVTFSTQADVDLAADMMKAAYDAGRQLLRQRRNLCTRQVGRDYGQGAARRLGWRVTATPSPAR
jgi:hypothetical protein